MDEIAKRIKHQQDVVKELTTWFWALAPICAGGAPRDWYHGNYAKDLDLFTSITSRPHQIVSYIKSSIPEILHIEVKDGKDLPDHYKGNPDLLCVYDIFYRGEDIQLIQIKSNKQDYINNFPCSLSKIWFDTEQEKIIPTVEFEASVLNNNIILYKDKVYNGDYFGKVVSKYPNYKYFYSDGKEYVKNKYVFFDFEQELDF